MDTDATDEHGGIEPLEEHDGIEPLDELTDGRVRALLTDLPDPGPMPADVAARIETALGNEALLRIEQGPLAATTTAATGPGTADPRARRTSDHDVLAPLLHRRRRPSPWLAAAAVAAAAAVVGVGGSALHEIKRPNGVANLGDSTTSASISPLPTSTPTPTAPLTSLATTAPATGSGTPAPTPTAPVTGLPVPAANSHIQTSSTNYTAATFAAQARSLVNQPGPALSPGSPEAPSLGPIATPLGLGGCLSALGVADPSAIGAVSADLALYDGQPAAVLVVTTGGTSTGYVVQRSCSANTPAIIVPATPIP